MKRTVWTTLLILAWVVGVSGSAFAGDGNFTVSSLSTIQGKALIPGNYTASWNDKGEVRLSRQNGGTFKVQGQIVERAEKAPRTSLLKQNDPSGESRVLELRFGGKKTVLVFGEVNVAQKQ